MDTFYLSIYASNHIVYEGDCESLVVPITNGQFGVLAHHENVVCAVSAGMLMYRVPGGENQYASISDGIMFIESNKVYLIGTAIEKAEEIDIARSEQDELEAEELLKLHKSKAEYLAAKAMIARNANRIKVKTRYGKPK